MKALHFLSISILICLIYSCGPSRSSITNKPIEPQQETTPAETQPPSVSGKQPLPAVKEPPQVEIFPTCSENEFSLLKEAMKLNDSAVNSIKKLGQFKDWAYNGSLVTQATEATRKCEELIAYHDKRPCQKFITPDNLKQYSGRILRERCELSRKYFYEFVQNKTNLQHKNADLFIDLTQGFNLNFEANYINTVQGCRIENPTNLDINYEQLSEAQIKSSRGFSEKMVVLEANEGLIISCYGLEIGEGFSKNQIQKLMNQQKVFAPLFYKLR